MPNNRLVRSESERMIGGVCGGLAEYLGIDTMWVRLAFVILGLASGIGLAIYIILWIIMPDEAKLESYEPLEITGDFGDVESYKSKAKPAATIGVIMVLFGGFFLFSQMGWVGTAFWPIVLIGAGIYVFLQRGR